MILAIYASAVEKLLVDIVVNQVQGKVKFRDEWIERKFAKCAVSKVDGDWCRQVCHWSQTLYVR